MQTAVTHPYCWHSMTGDRRSGWEFELLTRYSLMLLPLDWVRCPGVHVPPQTLRRWSECRDPRTNYAREQRRENHDVHEVAVPPWSRKSRPTGRNWRGSAIGRRMTQARQTWLHPLYIQSHPQKYHEMQLAKIKAKKAGSSEF